MASSAKMHPADHMSMLTKDMKKRFRNVPICLGSSLLHGLNFHIGPHKTTAILKATLVTEGSAHDLFVMLTRGEKATMT